MSTEPVLAVAGLTKSFGGDAVLSDASFEVGEGRVLGLVGPNGAGKTTCLRCILGLCFPDAGRVRVAGVDARADPVEARSRIGYLPGETSLYGGMRGRELIDFALSFHPAIDDALLERCLERFRLPLERRIRTYSAGQKQLLALVVALGPRVPLYILDEPDKALDATMRHELRRVLRELEDRGKTFLISSHHIAELEGAADDYVFLLDGRVVGSERIAQERRRLERQVRASFASPPASFPLPPGTTVDRREHAYVFTAPGNGDVAAIVEALLPLRPKSLEFGRSSLQDIYEALYVAERR